MRALPRSAALAASACVLALAATVRAEEPRPLAQEPQARRLFDEVAKLYKGLPAYADHGELSIAIKLNGELLKQSIETSVTFARPNKLVLNAGQVRLVCDGTRLTTSIAPIKKYVVAAAPETITRDVLADNPAGALLFSGPSGPALNTLWSLLLSNDPAKALLGPGSRLKLEADRRIEDQTYKSLVIDQLDGPDARLLIEPESRFVRKIELLIDRQSLETLKDELPVTDLAITWTAGEIATEVPSEKTFVFEPPAGFTRVAELSSRLQPGAEHKDPLQDLLGKPAPEFTLTVLDGPDKTKQLSRTDLAGKVVLIDFWATWCPPCMAELPEIQKLVDEYAKKSPQGVVVVALSLDTDPGDSDDVRKLVEKTLATKDLKLVEGPVSMVALDPLKTIGKAFHIAGIPTLIVLDGKGTVQAVHVGYRPDVRETLGEEIDSLLQGRSLVDQQKGSDPQEGGKATKN